jgi:hypothetical protein
MFLPVLVINSELNGIKKGAHFYGSVRAAGAVRMAVHGSCVGVRGSQAEHATATALL